MKLINLFLAGALAVPLASCVHVPVAEGVDQNDVIKTLNFRCDEPYELTRDCSSQLFALREVRIGGSRFNVAGSANGDVIFVQGPDPFLGCMTLDLLLLNCPSHSRGSNAGYQALKALLADKELEVQRVRPLLSAGNIVGYYLEAPPGTYDVVLSAAESD